MGIQAGQQTHSNLIHARKIFKFAM
jgi:hypothetical protein